MDNPLRDLRKGHKEIKAEIEMVSVDAKTRASSQSDAEEDTVVFARDTGERVAPQRRRFMRYETDEGESYYVEVGTQNSTWDLPPDGEVVART